MYRLAFQASLQCSSCVPKRFWLNGEFADAIRRRRKLSLRVLARSLNVTYGTLHCWLEQVRRIPRAKLEALARILNVPVRSLALDVPNV